MSVKITQVAGPTCAHRYVKCGFTPNQYRFFKSYCVTAAGARYVDTYVRYDLELSRRTWIVSISVEDSGSATLESISMHPGAYQSQEYIALQQAATDLLVEWWSFLTTY